MIISVYSMNRHIGHCVKLYDTFANDDAYLVGWILLDYGIIDETEDDVILGWTVREYQQVKKANGELGFAVSEWSFQ